MGSGTADLFLAGDIIYNESGCALSPDHLEFLDVAEKSQIVISESTASCFANQIAQSDIGLIKLDAEKVRNFWGLDEASDFTTSSLATHFPLFEEWFGPDVPLRMELNLHNILIAF